MPGKKTISKSNKTTPSAAKAGRHGWLRAALKWTATLAVWGVIASLCLLGWFAADLPDLSDALKSTRRPMVTILDSSGEEIYRGGDLYGQAVTIDQLPPSLPAAVLATEDRRFYGHFGVDPIGLARAMWTNVRAGRIVQGGSTITQQLAKNLFLTPERTIKRKVQEVMLAFWLEHKFSKDQIFTLYLNRVYLGSGAYGVDAAARRYFKKPAAALTTLESAVIAGLLKAPSRYNPIADEDRAYGRARVVLANMVAAGYLTEAQAKTAAARRSVAVAADAGGRLRARYFIDWVLDALPDFVTPGGRDLIVRTTLSGSMQRAAETAVARALRAGAARKAGQAALVAMTPTGAVRAMVGGGDYGKSQFNRAVQARRQPGSAFKPFVYLAALEAGMSPTTKIVDRPVAIGDWKPANFSGRYEGPVTLEQALAKSINTVAVRLTQKVGVGKVIQGARGLGLTGSLPKDAGLALGTGEVSLLELTGAYAGLSAGGKAVWPHGITEITDSVGNVLYKRAGSGPAQAADPDAARSLVRMMTGVISHGTGRNAGFGRPAAGKTGTSQNYRDAWFMGFTPQLTAGVWLGNDNGAPMDRVTGGSLPAAAWKTFMTAAHKGLQVAEFGGGDTPADDRLGKGSFWQRLTTLIGPASDDMEEQRSGD